VAEIREITTRNAGGVKQTRGNTDDLLKRANGLVTLVGQPVNGRSNGRAPRSGR
jgi:hypothetical protein